MSKFKVAALISLVAVLVFSLSSGPRGVPAGEAQGAEPAKAGPVPDLRVEALDGRSVSLFSAPAKVFLVFFFTTWSPPDRMMLPDLIRLNRIYRKKGVQFLAVSLDWLPPARIKAFAQEMRIVFPVYRADMEIVDAFGGVKRDEGLVQTPNCFLLSPDKRVLSRIIGRVSAERLTGEIERALGGEER